MLTQRAERGTRSVIKISTRPLKELLPPYYHSWLTDELGIFVRMVWNGKHLVDIAEALPRRSVLAVRSRITRLTNDGVRSQRKYPGEDFSVAASD